MAYNVKLYKFGKKKNSTAQPGQEVQSLAFNCRLMDGSGMLNPTFLFDFSVILNEQPTGYNYAYVSEWNRYYFIKDWAYNLGLWNCSMTVDVLASWRYAIGSVNTFIKRCSYLNTKKHLEDRYPLQAEGDIINTIDPGNFSGNIDNGCFVLGITGMYSAVGSVNYYVTNRSGFNQLISKLFNSADYLNITEISDGLQKALFNPIQYINSVFFFPFPLSSITNKTAVAGVNYGWWGLSPLNNFYLLGTNPHVEMGITMSIPKHPNSASGGSWLNLSPYTTYNLIYHPYGQWMIDSTILCKYRTLVLAQTIDLISGNGTLYQSVYEENTGQNLQFDSRVTQIGVPISMAQMTRDVAGGVSSALGFAGSLFTGNVGGALTSAVSAAQSMIPKAQILGTNGGFNTYNLNVILQTQFMYPSNINPGIYGYPYYDNNTISAIPGYIEAEPGNNAIPCTDSELFEINSYFENGFYYE